MKKSLIVFVPDKNHVLLRIMEMEMNSLSEEDEIPNKPKYVFSHLNFYSKTNEPSILDYWFYFVVWLFK